MFKCNCRWTELIAGLVILILTIWPTMILSAKASWWIVIIAAVVLILHSVFHHKCGCEMCTPAEMKAMKKKRR